MGVGLEAEVTDAARRGPEEAAEAKGKKKGGKKGGKKSGGGEL